jgi:hypothetical protein
MPMHLSGYAGHAPPPTPPTTTAPPPQPPAEGTLVWDEQQIEAELPPGLTVTNLRIANGSSTLPGAGYSAKPSDYYARITLSAPVPAMDMDKRQLPGSGTDGITIYEPTSEDFAADSCTTLDLGQPATCDTAKNAIEDPEPDSSETLRIATELGYC